MTTETTALNVKFTGDNEGVVDAAEGSSRAVKGYGETVENTGKKQRKFTTAQRDARRASKAFGKELATTAKLVAGLGVALGGVQIASKFKETAIETDRLRAVLKVAEGSARSAGIQFDLLSNFASKNVVQVDEAVEAYVKMKNLGLDPTEKALQSFADTAVAQGKSLQQFIEAVADASTNEFERLKEFGIKASQELDEVTFTFQGTETTVQKTSENIVGYLTEIGETNFAGANAEQMGTLVGLTSNLEQEVDNLFRAMGDAGASQVYREILRDTTEVIADMREGIPGVVDNLEELTDGLVVLGAFAITRTAGPALVVLTTRLLAASSGMSVAASSATVLRGALTFLGGPVGIAVTAATALLVFGNNAENAAGRTERLTKEATDLNEALRTLSQTEARAELAKLESNLLGVEAALAKAREAVEKHNKDSSKRIGGTLGVSATDITKFAELNKTVAELGEEAGLTRAQIDGLKQIITDLGDEEAAAAGHTEDLADATTKLTKAQQSQISRINSAAKSQENWRKELEALAELKPHLTVEAYTQEVERLGEKYTEATKATAEFTSAQKRAKEIVEGLRDPQQVYNDELAELVRLRHLIGEDNFEAALGQANKKLLEENAKAAKQAGDAWTDFGDTLEDAFVDSFANAGDSLDNFIDRVKTSFKEAAFRTLFQNTFGQLFGQTASGGSGGGFNVGGIVQTFGGKAVSSLGSLFGGGASSTAALSSGTGASSAGSAGAAGGASIGLASASIIGGIVAGAIDIKNAEDNGYTTGDVLLGDPNADRLKNSALGKYQPGILNPFTAIRRGVEIIPGIGKLISSFGGDGKKRFNTGIRQGTDTTDPDNTATAASGLRIQAYERRGDEDAAASLQQVALEIDEALTTALRASGIGVDFTNTTLKGSAGEGGHVRDGNFFGAFGFNGKNEGADLKTAADNFTQAWLDEVNEQLPARVRRSLSGLDQTAEELTGAISSAFTIDNLLNLNVVNQSREFFEEGQRNLAETYSTLTDAVYDANSGLDGTAAGLNTLAVALVDQKDAAAALADAYRVASIEVDSLLGNTIQSIRESTLSEEELYALRREQIADLNAELATAQSPDDINRLVGEIDSLTNQAFGLLDDGQKSALQEEFISFLQGVADTSSGKLDAGLASLAETERDVQQTIDAQESNDQLVQLADRVEAVNTQFDELLARLSAGGSGFNLFNLGVSATEVNT